MEKASRSEAFFVYPDRSSHAWSWPDKQKKPAVRLSFFHFDEDHKGIRHWQIPSRVLNEKAPDN